MTKSDDFQELSERQIKAIPFLVASPTIESGCRKAKISRETYYTWIADPTFKTELKKARDHVIDEAMSTIKGGMKKAAETLVRLLGKTKSETLKKAIAIDILSLGMKAVELSDIEERLTKIEAALERKSK